MEIHDGLGQTLVGTRMLAEVLAERLRFVASAEAGKAERIATLVGDALSEAKAMARAMNPVDAAPEGLASALQALAVSLNASWADTGRRIIVEAIPVDFPDRRQALHLYRITQEAISNALRHSESAAIRVRLSQRERDVVLEVTDDGPARSGPAGAHDAEREGMGHHGMPYRAALIGAEFHRGPQEGGGMLVRVVLPLDAIRKPENVRTAER
jgi:signal transduction histidine kinase